MVKHVISETIHCMPEDLLKDNIFKTHFPDKPQIADFSETKSMRDYAKSAKQVADQYRLLIWDGLLTASKEFKNDFSLGTHMALAGLACEIHIKGLLFKLNRLTPAKRKVHDLVKLYNGLDDDSKQRIRKDVEEYCTESINSDEELDCHKTFFNDFRYSYELNGYSINPHFMLSLMDALHKIGNERNQRE